MNLLAEIHGYPPHHNSGAEWMAHHIFRYLSKKGFNVVVLLNFNSYLGKIDEAYTFEGVKVVSDVDWQQWYKWADIVFTHLDKTGKAYNRCRDFKKPLFHLIHNNYKNVVVENQNGIDQFAIYNTQWVRDDRKEHHKCIHGSRIVHPPVYVKDYETRHINNYITLINLNPNKGGDFLIQLAKELPEKKFMGVYGSYGEQQVDFKQKNIHYLLNGDIMRVYKRTRVLLMPSWYESYGRTAIEAAASGIPVICNETPGLREALGDAGIYCDRKNIKEWVFAIKMLDYEPEYQKQSDIVRKRALSMNPDKELNELIKFINHECKNIENARKRDRQLAL